MKRCDVAGRLGSSNCSREYKAIIFLTHELLMSLFRAYDRKWQLQDFWISKNEYEENGLAQCIRKLGMK